MTQANTMAPAAIRPGPDRFVVGLALAGLVVLGGLVWLETAPFLLALFAIGAVLGVALYHGAFGFTAGWRNLVTKKRGAGMRAQLLLFALAALIMIPILGSGRDDVIGAVAPVGTSLVVGSFLFGIGMQLGGGCGSGTLFTVGAGNLRMMVTLLFFIVGAVLGSIHLPWWLDLPAVDPISLIDWVGVPGAIAVQWLGLGAVALWVNRIERRAHGDLERTELRLRPIEGSMAKALFTGRWPFLWAIIVLAVGNALTLVIGGSPWGITFAFNLWGAKALQGLGVDMGQFEFWNWAYPAQALADSVLVNIPSVMNFGLLLGAMLAAGMARRFNEASRQTPRGRPFLAAVVGGLLLGYGARLGFGCNIGALFSGLASASVHAWVWFACAFAGSLIGVRLRPWFRLPN
ncbi:putative inner membrane protein [Halomonas sp. THAF12]|uniref:YeeE/YedE family protein n=1 Tax=Halomonas sp. THAF12 TaxID=2587849 RepID=UPI0012A8DDD2|nr:YeeE/YedE family protein [Halomonas sp. THAF12]QFT85338.1 putative inner membrane protein [Halomonas sp. THAF12]